MCIVHCTRVLLFVYPPPWKIIRYTADVVYNLKHFYKTSLYYVVYCRLINISIFNLINDSTKNKQKLVIEIS